MKKLRLFDSLKFVRAMFVAVVVATAFILNVAHAATLPAGYTELEYLETDGNAYIDTGILLSTTDVLETELMVTNLNATKHIISTGGTVGSGFFQIAQTSSLLLVDFGTPSGGGRVSTDTITSFNNKVLLKANVATKEFYVNNTYVGNAPNSDFIGSANSIKLFALPGEPDIRIYNFKILGKINLVPARRDSDGVLGMYDLADSNPATAFHTNAGTGNFIAGEYQIKIATTKYNEQQFAPVETDLDAAVAAVDTVVTQTMTQAQQIDQIATNKQTRPDEGCDAKYCLLVEDEDGTPHWYPIAGANGVAHNLPAGYTELQYLQSSGTQRIVTDLTGFGSGNWEIYTKFMSTSETQTSYGYIVSVYNGESTNSYRVIFSGTNGQRFLLSGNNKASGGNIAVAGEVNRVYEATVKNGSVVFDGVTYETPTQGTALANNIPLTILGGVIDGNPRAKARIYSVKATQDGVLRANYIPAKNSSGVVGLYDMVSGQFFTNAGTGDFAAGPDM